MISQCSLPCHQRPTSDAFLQLVEIRPHNTTRSFNNNFKIITPLCLRLSNILFSSPSTNKTVYAFLFFGILATSLDLITVMFDQAYEEVYISSRDIIYMHTILFVCVAGEKGRGGVWKALQDEK